MRASRRSDGKGNKTCVHQKKQKKEKNKEESAHLNQTRGELYMSKGRKLREGG